MARNEITFQVNLKKDTNSASRTYGMYFGEAESKEPLNLKGFDKFTQLTEYQAFKDLIELALFSLVLLQR